MSLNCEYHPTVLAHWQCQSCFKSFCPSCVSERLGGHSGQEKMHFCPSCNKEVEWIAAANTIVPFWNRIPKFFTYPFNRQTLILMVVLALASTLFSVPFPFFGYIRFLRRWFRLVSIARVVMGRVVARMGGGRIL